MKSKPTTSATLLRELEDAGGMASTAIKIAFRLLKENENLKAERDAYRDEVKRAHGEYWNPGIEAAVRLCGRYAAERDRLREAIHDARAVLEAPPLSEDIGVRSHEDLSTLVCAKADEAKRILAEVDDEALQMDAHTDVRPTSESVAESDACKQ